MEQDQLQHQLSDHTVYFGEKLKDGLMNHALNTFESDMHAQIDRKRISQG